MQAPEAQREETGRSVLVVEDDRATRELLAEILTEERLRFHVTSTGHEAMEYARDHPPAMVVLDMHLPNLQGEAVATALKIEFGQALPILAMSASNEWPAAERLGAFGYLQKPFEVDDFRRSSAAWLGPGRALEASAGALERRASQARTVAAAPAAVVRAGFGRRRSQFG